MTTQKDILRTMMTQLDEDSDKIPEGLYLKFCDHLKNLHTCQPASVALQRRLRLLHALNSSYENGQTPIEADIERTAVFRIYHSDSVLGLTRRSIVVEVDLPGVETRKEITIKVGLRLRMRPDLVFIKVPGKYKQLISLPVKVDRIVSTTWNARTHSLTFTLQMVEA